jgi:2-oxoisovalerate dehydrogenase E1 component alpha subunit
MSIESVLTAADLGTTNQLLQRGHAAMVAGRHFDQQATNLAKQGFLTVYPSSLGQEACQVAAALALEPSDWLFPTYRDSVAISARGIAPEQVLTLFHGSWHCGYDPKATKTAPHSTPLATHLAHAVGAAMAARLDGDEIVALALCGDGATSEGDFHEALNLAAVFHAPVVFLVQNNGYAISVPASQQLRAESIAAKGMGYGMPAQQVDGNDFLSVHTVLAAAVEHARAGDGPTLIEATTYRMGPHTNSDDPDRYRSREEAKQWRDRDPIALVRSQMLAAGIDVPAAIASAEEVGRVLSEATRAGVARLTVPDPGKLVEHVYATVPKSLNRQTRQLNPQEGDER